MKLINDSGLNYLVQKIDKIKHFWNNEERSNYKDSSNSESLDVLFKSNDAKPAKRNTIIARSLMIGEGDTPILDVRSNDIKLFRNSQYPDASITASSEKNAANVCVTSNKVRIRGNLELVHRNLIKNQNSDTIANIPLINKFYIRDEKIFLGNEKYSSNNFNRQNYLRMSHSHTYLVGGNILSLNSTSGWDNYGSIIIGADSREQGFLPVRSGITEAVESIYLTTNSSDIVMGSTIRARASNNIYLCAGYAKGNTRSGDYSEGGHISLVGGTIRILSTADCASSTGDNLGYNGGFNVSIEERRDGGFDDDTWRYADTDYQKRAGNRLHIGYDRTSLYNKTIHISCVKDINCGYYFKNNFNDNISTAPTGSMIYLSEDKAGIRSVGSRILLRDKQIRINTEKFKLFSDDECIFNIHINNRGYNVGIQKSFSYGEKVLSNTIINNKYQGSFAFDNYAASFHNGIAYGAHSIIFGGYGTNYHNIFTPTWTAISKERTTSSLYVTVTYNETDIQKVIDIYKDYYETQAEHQMYGKDFYIIISNNNKRALTRATIYSNTHILHFYVKDASKMDIVDSNNLSISFIMPNHAVFGDNSFVNGLCNLSYYNNQTVIGQYNTPEDKAFIIGGGTNTTTGRKNIFTVDWNGNVNANDYRINGTSILQTLQDYIPNEGNSDDSISLNLIRNNIILQSGNTKSKLNITPNNCALTAEDSLTLSSFDGDTSIVLENEYSITMSTSDTNLHIKDTGIILDTDQTAYYTHDSATPTSNNEIAIKGDVYAVAEDINYNLFELTLDDIKRVNTTGTWNNNVYTVNNITFTVNTSDNYVTSITANGTAQSQAQLQFPSISNLGNVNVSGCPQGGTSSTYHITTYTDHWTNQYDYGNGVLINNTTNELILIIIKSGYTANSLVFRPMVTKPFYKGMPFKLNTYDVAVDNFENTSGSWCNITFMPQNVSTATLKKNDGLILYTQNGTSSAKGNSYLVIGNNKSGVTSGNLTITNGNKTGIIRLYGQGTAYTQISTKVLETNRTIYFPDKEGTLAITDDLKATETNNDNGGWYYLPFILNPTSPGYGYNDGIRIYSKQGKKKVNSTTTQGHTYLQLGNDISIDDTTNDGNKTGIIRLYGKYTAYAEILTPDNLTANTQYKLPFISGVTSYTLAPFHADMVVLSQFPGSKNFNQIATYGNAIGYATNVTSTDSKINPPGTAATDAYTFINMSYKIQGQSAFYLTQIANKAGTTDLWVRSRNGGAISDSTAWVAPWTRILTESNYSSICNYIPNVGNITDDNLSIERNGITLSAITNILLSAEGSVSLEASSGSIEFETSDGHIVAKPDNDHKFYYGSSSVANNEVATIGHTHTTTIATSTGTNQLTLAFGTKYAITAGETSYVFTMPANPNTDTKVRQTNNTTSAEYRLLLSYAATNDQQDNISYKSANFTANPSTGDLTVGNAIKAKEVQVNAKWDIQTNATTGALEFNLM